MERETGPESPLTLSVLVLTLNEEANLTRCLGALAWCEDVVILDSGSTDRTLEIARSFPNTRIFYRAFDDYSAQRNHGLHEIPYRHPWVLILDADEVAEPDLLDELRRRLPSASPETHAFHLRRDVMFEGRRLVRNLTSDTIIARVARPQAVRFAGRVHEKLLFDGQSEALTGRLLHYQFTKGVEDWKERRRRYATLAASAAIEDQTPIRLDRLLSDPLERWLALKHIYGRLPLRWLLYLLVTFAVKAPYLEGARGCRYVLLETWSHLRNTREFQRARHDRLRETCAPADS